MALKMNFREVTPEDTEILRKLNRFISARQH